MKFSAVIRPLSLSAAALFLVNAAQAHPGHDGGHDLTWDFSAGALHPLGGFDHLLAMIAVGVWAAQLGGKARWAIPAAFLTMLSAGAALGAHGTTFSWLEQGIAASVLALGLLVATAKRLPLAAGLALATVFALFHGIAHGAEMQAGGDALHYAAGFIASTALLHAIGFGFGSTTLRSMRWMPQAAGAGLMIAGGLLLITH